MSKKKNNKKRHSQSSINAKKLAREEEIADFKDRDRKRLKPLARNILLGDLVMLAATQFLYTQDVLPDVLYSGLSILGLVLLFIALYVQFVDGRHNRRSL